MAGAALALPNGLSLVTLSDRRASGWGSLFDWAGQGDHIDYKADTRTERNLLGARLDAAVTRADRAVLLVAEGASCFATAWWARLTPASYVSRVAGALFFRPVEDEREGDGLMQTFASPRTALPFPSIVLGNDREHAELLPHVRAIADNWGSRVVVDRPVEEDRALYRTRRLIGRFTSIIVEDKVRAAHGILGRPVQAIR